jgi:Zn-dependent protease
MKRQEFLDLLLSWLTISLAFAWVFSGFREIDTYIYYLPLTGIAVGAGFIFHELAHRTVAKHFHAHAFYKAWPFGLVFVLITALIGFIFAAPGAVYIFGNNIDRKKNGLISLAGPATNVLLAGIFAVLFWYSDVGSFYQKLGALGAAINVWLAAFNLIPIPPLDGSKVFQWNPLIWAVPFIISWLLLIQFALPLFALF